MKKLILLFILPLFYSCNDGDLITTTFDFDDASLQACGDAGGYLFFKLNDAGSESISLRLGTTNELFLATDTLVSTLDGTTNFVNYRIFDGSIGADYFCNEVPPTNPAVSAEYIASSGTSTLITTTTLNDSDGIPTADEPAGDADGDGLPNFYDFDDDGDNVPTSAELDTENLDGDNNPLTDPLDSDDDKIPDYLDEDDDDDGIPTRYEANGTLDPTLIATDPSVGPDYLNPDVSVEVVIDEFREHTYTFDSDIDLVLNNLTLINGEEQIIRETLDMGMINSILTGTFTITPVFPPN